MSGAVTYEIRPCVETDEGEVYQVPPNEAEFWTVYRRGDDGLALAVCDLMSKADAELIVSMIELAEKVERIDFKYGINRDTTRRDAAKILNAIKERIAA